MIHVRRLRPSEWSLYRQLRLAALADAPDAFGSTLAGAIAHPDVHWHERLDRADADTSHPLVATLDGSPCALAWVMTDLARPGTAGLFQMWVSPEARGRGVGHHLLNACIDWAISRGHVAMRLDCTLGNEPARRLYERHGFVVTGEREPLREGSDVLVGRMERILSGA